VIVRCLVAIRPKTPGEECELPQESSEPILKFSGRIILVDEAHEHGDYRLRSTPKTAPLVIWVGTPLVLPEDWNHDEKPVILRKRKQ
jgi:hypothetical protein